MLSLFFIFVINSNAETPQCQSSVATAAYQKGFEAQKNRQTTEALEAYKECLKVEDSCVPCQWEIGWSYWSRSEWDMVKKHWKKASELKPSEQQYKDYLEIVEQKSKQPLLTPRGIRIPMGTTSVKNGVEMKLVARFQNYNSKLNSNGDNYDQMIYSPKSARYSSDGTKVYVNSLEGFRTVIYDPKTLKNVGSIEHKFDESTEDLFQNETTVFDYKFNKKSPSGNPNHFQGKPVESALSHDGRYLWVPYYRRDFDKGATSPSAVSIVDTQTNKIVRMMPTGPIPKYVAISPDNKWAAIAHWGDNTLGIVDISSGDPKTFKYLPERLVVEKVLAQKGLTGTNRDSTCGYCLRGTIFTPDSKTLLVSRMGGGGVAGFDVETWSYLGTLTGEKPTPRHLVISKDGQYLYMSSNRSGYISKTPLTELVQHLRATEGKRVRYENWTTTHVGTGARTIEVTDDGKWLFAAINNSAELVLINTENMKIVNRVRTDSYAVGLAISSDGSQAWVTSQGKKSGGGNSVCVYSIQKLAEQ